MPEHGPPYVGALLRLAWQTCRQRLLEALQAAGFDDLNDAYLNVLQYPPPDGVRPVDLAVQTRMTKQALNYLLAQLESLGYLERRAEGRGNGRRVYLTDKGWRACRTMWKTMQRVEAEWAAGVGKDRFEGFLAILRQLTGVAARSAEPSGD